MLRKLFRALLPVEKELTPIQEAVALLEKNRRVKGIIHGNIRTIRPLYSNIAAYSKALDKFIYAVDNNNHYVPDAVEPAKVDWSTFYTNEQGYFISVEEYHERFVDKAIKVLRLYEEIDSREDKNGFAQTISYQALYLVDNLIMLSRAFDVMES